MNSEGRLFAGFTGNCFIWKIHHSRGFPFGSRKVAQEAIEYHEVHNIGAVHIIHESELEVY
tara:strand:- start:189 stop:371 length:183 start_codon:yes stop_codon:yes gene_type:complete